MKNKKLKLALHELEQEMEVLSLEELNSMKGGKVYSPIFDSMGNFIGTDENGYTGTILIRDASGNTQEIHSMNLSAEVKAKIEQHVVNHYFDDQDRVVIVLDQNSSKSGYYVTDGNYYTEDGKFIIHKYNGEIELYTVEDLWTAIIGHEINGHILGSITADDLEHYLAFLKELDFEHFGSTSDYYKHGLADHIIRHYEGDNGAFGRSISDLDQRIIDFVNDYNTQGRIFLPPVNR